ISPYRASITAVSRRAARPNRRLNMPGDLRSWFVRLGSGCIVGKAGLPLFLSRANRCETCEGRIGDCLHVLSQFRNFKQMTARMTFIAGAGIAAAALTACNAGSTLGAGETLAQGYVVDQGALDLVPVGSSREQVMLTLG